MTSHILYTQYVHCTTLHYIIEKPYTENNYKCLIHPNIDKQYLKKYNKNDITQMTQ